MTRRQHGAAFCSICADDIHGIPIRRPLGRGGALVNVCVDCDQEPIRARSDVRGYQAPGSILGVGAAVERLARATGVVSFRRGNETAKERTPGFVLVRVPIAAPDGTTRDRQAALATLAGEPWAASARYLSTTSTDPSPGSPRGAGYHLFERPADKAPDVGPAIEWLEQFREPGGAESPSGAETFVEDRDPETPGGPGARDDDR